MSADHSDILVALIGVVVATLPLMVGLIFTIVYQARRTRGYVEKVVVAPVAKVAAEVDEIRPHLPPNGTRLYEMVEATANAAQELQETVMRVQAAIHTLQEDVAHIQASVIPRGGEG